VQQPSWFASKIILEKELIEVTFQVSEGTMVMNTSQPGFKVPKYQACFKFLELAADQPAHFNTLIVWK
jgi:hypothetical protein